MKSKGKTFLSLFSILLVILILTAVLAKSYFLIDEDEEVSIEWYVEMGDHHIGEAAGTVSYAIPEVYKMVYVITVMKTRILKKLSDTSQILINGIGEKVTDGPRLRLMNIWRGAYISCLHIIFTIRKCLPSISRIPSEKDCRPLRTHVSMGKATIESTSAVKVAICYRHRE